MDIYAFIGYAGSFLIAVSLTMKNIVHLRWINLLGALIFAVYGLIVEAYPVFFLDLYIAIVDIYYLVRIYKEKDAFSLVPVLNESHLYLKKFIKHYRDDIKKFIPEFSLEKLNNPQFYFILRNLMPAGLFVFEEMSGNEIEVKLDYAIPEYRDNKNGKFIYSAEENLLLEKGYNRLITFSNVKAHIKYLIKSGYKLDEDATNMYVKTLA